MVIGLISVHHTGTRTTWKLLDKADEIDPNIYNRGDITNQLDDDMLRFKNHHWYGPRLNLLDEVINKSNYKHILIYLWFVYPMTKHLLLNHDVKLIVPIRHPYKIATSFLKRHQSPHLDDYLELLLYLSTRQANFRFIPVDKLNSVSFDERLSYLESVLEEYLELKVTDKMRNYIKQWHMIGKDDPDKNYSIDNYTSDIVQQEIAQMNLLEHLKKLGVDYG